MIEDVVNMLLRIPIAWNGVLLLIKSVGELNRALLRKSEPTGLCHSLSSSSPPAQLSHVRQYDTRGVGEGLDVFGHVDVRTSIDSALAADDAVREDAEILVVLVEEDDDAFLGLNICRNEDWDIGIGFFGIEGESDLGEAEGGEAVRDDSADCFCLKLRDWRVEAGCSGLPFMDSRWMML